LEKVKKTLHPTTRCPRNPSHPPPNSNKECETKSYASEAGSSMYAKTTKSMLKLSEVGTWSLHHPKLPLEPPCMKATLG